MISLSVALIMFMRAVYMRKGAPVPAPKERTYSGTDVDDGRGAFTQTWR